MASQNRSPIVCVRYGQFTKELGEAGQLFIGRAANADIVIDHNSVSRKHLCIAMRGGKIYIRDLGSANGSALDGTPMHKDIEQEIQPGQRITVGDPQVIVEVALVDRENQARAFNAALASLPLENQTKVHAEGQTRTQLDAPALELEDAPHLRPNAATIARLEAKQEQLRAEIETLYGLRKNWQEKVAHLQNEYSVMEAKIAGTESQILRLQTELRDLGNQKTEVEANIEEVRHRLATSEQRLGIALNNEKVTEDGLANARNELHQLEGQVKTAEQFLAGAEQKRKEAEQGKADADELRISVETQARALREETAELKKQISALQESIGRLQADEAEASAAFETTREALRKARAEAEIQESERKVINGRMDVENQLLLNQKAKAEAELSGIQFETEKTRSQYESMKQQLSTAEDSLKTAKDQSAALQNEAATAEATRDRLQAEIRDLEQKHAEQNIKLQQLRTASKDLVAENQKDKELLEKQLTAERAAREEREAQYFREERRKLETEIAAQRTQQNKLLAEEKKLAELQVTEMKVREMGVAKALLDEEEKARRSRRSHEAQVLCKKLEQTLGARLTSVLGGARKEEIDAILSLIPEQVNESLLPKKNTEPGKTTVAIAVDSKSRAEARKFWIQSGWATGAATLLILTFAMIPDLKGKIGRTTASLFTSDQSASDQYVQEVQRIRAARPKYEPTVDQIFKDTYTKNILHTYRYTEMKESPEQRKKWILALNHFFLDELQLKEQAIVQFAAAETALTRELVSLKDLINPSFEKEGLARMAEAETRGIEELKTIIAAKNYERLREFEKDFYLQFVYSAQ